ncbi:MAG: O-antigen ligase family protein [Candidatus Omnitrophota bacterium]
MVKKYRVYKKLLWILLAAILIFSPIARGASVRLWAMTPILLVELIIIFLWLFKVVNVSPNPAKPKLTTYNLRLTTNSIDLPILLLTVLAAISFVFSIYKHDSFYALLRLLGYIGVYYVIINEFDGQMVKRLIYLIISMGGCLSLYGLFQYFGTLPHSWWIPQDFLASTYVNHNHFAGYLELAMPVAIAELFNQMSRLKGDVRVAKDHRVFLVTALIFMASAFILAQSRGAWLSMGVSLIVMMLVIRKRRTINIKSILIFILVLMIIFSFVYLGRETISDRLKLAYAPYGADLFDGTRLKIWKGSVDMIIHNPAIGTGIGTFIWGFPRFRPEGLVALANAAHNDYLQMAAEMGLLAPFLMLWIFVVIIKTGFTKEARNSLRSVGCAAGVLSLALHGLIDFNFHIPANMLLFTVYAAIIMKK